MSRKKLKVLALVHPTQVPEDVVLTPGEVKQKPWKMEYDIRAALRTLGHDVRFLGVDDELKPIRDAVREWSPDLAFNMLEFFHGESMYDQHVAAWLELLRLPYTGNSSRGLFLAREKALSKKIAAYHRVLIPDFFVVLRGRRVRRPKRLDFPLIVKALREDASVGISRASVVESDDALRARVEYLQERFEADVIVEQFIAGREVYQGVLGNQRLAVFEPWELFIENRPKGTRLIATEKAKFDPVYQDKVGVLTGPMTGVDDNIRRRFGRISRRLYRALFQSGYSRMDYRIDTEGRIYFLEANPNPDLSREEDLAKSADVDHIDYETLIKRVLSLALRR